MQSKLIFLFACLLIIIPFTGCITTPPQGQVKPDPIPGKEPEKIVIYEPKENIELQEVGRIRKDPIFIQLDIFKDKQLNRYIIDAHQFETLGLKVGEQVVWVCSNNIPFTVHFGWDSPFQKGVFVAQKVDDRTYMTEPAIVRKKIPLAAASIPFKYFIAAYIKEFDTVVTYDPRILFVPPDYEY